TAELEECGLDVSWRQADIRGNLLRRSDQMLAEVGVHTLHLLRIPAPLRRHQVEGDITGPAGPGPASAHPHKAKRSTEGGIHVRQCTTEQSDLNALCKRQNRAKQLKSLATPEPHGALVTRILRIPQGEGPLPGFEDSGDRHMRLQLEAQAVRR